MLKTNPLLSIIATSYSRERLEDIYNLVDSIEAQTYKNIELMFVVQGSVEFYNRIRIYIDTKKIAQVNVIFNEKNPGASSSRNMGIRQAKGELIAIVDDDVVLSPDWAEEMAKTYQDESITGVTGPALPHWEDESMSWFPDEFSWLWGGTLWGDWGDKISEIENVGGMNCSFRREAFDKAGGYLTCLKTLQEGGWFQPTGEEVEFSLRVRQITGKRIVFNPRVKVYHKVYKSRFRIRVIAKRSFRMGYLKHMARNIYPHGKHAESAPRAECVLIKRIFNRLLPQIFKGFFTHPFIAWRKLTVCIISVLFAGLGYILYVFKPFKMQSMSTET